MTKFTGGSRACALCFVAAVLVACGSGPTDQRGAGADTAASVGQDTARSLPTTAGSAATGTPLPGTPTPGTPLPSTPLPGTSLPETSPPASRPPGGATQENPSAPNPPDGSTSASQPPAEDTDAPLPGQSGPQGGRTVEVSGPTVDNRYPAAPLTFSAAGVICNPFTNGAAPGDTAAAGVPVTIRSIDVVDQVPAGEPVFRVVPAPDLAACGSGPEPLDVGSNCTDATLPPYSEPSAAACALGLEFSGTTDHVATIRFALEATCTDVSAIPCDSAEVRPLSPTPEAPVVVRWIDSSSTVAACPENPPEPGSGGSC